MRNINENLFLKCYNVFLNLNKVWKNNIAMPATYV